MMSLLLPSPGGGGRGTWGVSPVSKSGTLKTR